MLGDADTFIGLIYKSDGNRGNITKSNNARMITELKDVQTKLGEISGSWLNSLSIDNKLYWNIDDYLPERQRFKEICLPSDCRFREDLIWLKRNYEKLADLWKVRLEV
jgi:hypothetical protein